MASPPHERLGAYRKSIEAVALLEGVSRALPSSRADLRDQLQRASASISLNLAEGAAEFAPAEKSRFYRMSRRSAAECLAILDVVQAIVPSFQNPEAARATLEEVMAMVTALIQAAERRKG